MFLLLPKDQTFIFYSIYCTHGHPILCIYMYVNTLLISDSGFYHSGFYLFSLLKKGSVVVYNCILVDAMLKVLQSKVEHYL